MRTRALIDLESLAANYQKIRATVGPSVTVLPVLKADAYGHGAIEVVRTLSKAGAGWFAVSCLGEGVALRLAGIGGEIVVLCGFLPGEEADGRTFISMAYLEGRELADEIAEGPMEVQRVLDLVTQYADGLAEAHSKGVVHRDIKPANLFVTPNGRGVVLDFGLAQLASTDSRLTREGTTLGTVHYMSPEQTIGTEIDAATDVWALGCVLYEMLAGDPPFRGHYEQAIVYSILNEKPVPLEISSPEVEAVIRRCLAKDQGERYQDGEALHRALREIQPSSRTSGARTPAGPSEVPRVAVLPFKTWFARCGDQRPPVDRALRPRPQHDRYLRGPGRADRSHSSHRRRPVRRVDAIVGRHSKGEADRRTDRR